MMDEQQPLPPGSTTWQDDIRALEQSTCSAFLAVDLPALEKMWSESYVVNSPLQQVLTKQQLLEALRTGRIRHREYDFEIEHMSRHADTVIVMGRDRVVDPPDGKELRRRFTNVWQLVDGVWRGVARHAHVPSREPHI